MKEFSKKMAFVAWMPFLICIGLAIYIIISGNTAEIPTDLMIAMFTASAGIAGTTNIFYLRKSQAENTYKVKLSLYEEISKTDIEHTEGLLKLREKYGDTDVNSPISDMVSEALNDVTDHVDRTMDDATQPIEKEEF